MKKILLLVLLTLTLMGCQPKEEATLIIGGIPDQNTSTLTERFDELAKYIEKETGIKTEYVPSADYAALVTGFSREEVHLGWFGGLTGVQARSQVEGSEAIAHRPRDAEFESVFIYNTANTIENLNDLKDKSFTFGSESSTSGHLMPRFFLMEVGLTPEETFSDIPNYSGSHDKTWKLVESGTFDAGALNIAVWESAVDEGKVDTDKVKVFYTTPHYFDYNWSITDVDKTFGQGSKDKIKSALLKFGADNPEIMALFQDTGFVETNNDNYQAILDVAKSLDIIE
ncbi:putative selenate ABC transporter substrate-binding protein [Acidaminobacter sp. JC074]|uniref:putative selenate ABC transporter substrate-binding protein n=1 Tax=Acidaminobacter sp. JC074 TaxID=2530199 RepID=UPI001F0E86EA|nr:putative selenate ABC transporter substrate-binding protein [Acidaminobacter sp. JC074]MCH4888692.1 putative selenate ABC transporter substrate-binding protein [Acidaminobacter sp. JC074]